MNLIPYMITKIAVIGSFRQHYDKILSVIDTFKESGLEVTSPAGAEIIEPDIEFVRFTSDSVESDDSTVQSVTIRRIFAADIVYVVAPNGYIGRTTCYEIGRLVQAQLPIYFSEVPKDLPVFVPDEFVASEYEIIERFVKKDTVGQWLFQSSEHPAHLVERELHYEQKKR